jgi:hypothetical protein
MRNYICGLLLLTSLFLQGQELNCVVSINSDRIDNTNQQVFKTLQKAISEFVNKTKWTEQSYKTNERIDCTMFINVSSYSNDQFSATIQVQSARPVYNSSYSTTVLNFNDKDFNFKYQEFENLLYNPNSFESNLVSVLAFYSYMIIGMDADTFSPLGGTDYYVTAQEIVNVAQSSGFKGWNQIDGNQNRYFLVSDLLSNTYAPIRDLYYTYHMDGLDKMADNPAEAKENIKESLMSLQSVYTARSNAFLTRVFFDAKAEEIQSMFSGGPKTDIAELISSLNRFSPTNASKWSTIRY